MFGRRTGWRVSEQARTMVPHHPRCEGRPERCSRADDNKPSRVLPWRSGKAQKSSLRLGFLVNDSQTMAPCNVFTLRTFSQKKKTGFALKKAPKLAILALARETQFTAHKNETNSHALSAYRAEYPRGFEFAYSRAPPRAPT